MDTPSIYIWPQIGSQSSPFLKNTQQIVIKRNKARDNNQRENKARDKAREET